MNKTKFIIIAISFLSCISPVKIIRGPGYLPESIEKRTLVVVPFIDSVEMKYSGDVSRELGKGLKENVITNFIYNQIKFGLNDSSIFNNVINDTCLEPPLFIPRQINQNDTFPALIANQNILLKKKSGDIILFIFNLRISDPILLNTLPGTFIPVPSNRALSFQCKFMFWDNIALKEIYFGKLSLNYIPSSPIFTYNQWDESVDALAGMIIHKTKFRRNNY